MATVIKIEQNECHHRANKGGKSELKSSISTGGARRRKPMIRGLGNAKSTATALSGNHSANNRIFRIFSNGKSSS